MIIYPDIEVCQIYYHTIKGDYDLYSSGKYQNNTGIQSSLMYKDFMKRGMYMNLYLIERDDKASYDEYVSAIVCAESEEEAVKIHPNGDIFDTVCRWGSEWVKDPSHVECKKIGVADESVEKGVVLASFNAG